VPVLEDADRQEIAKLLSENLGGDVTLSFYRGSALTSAPEAREMSDQTWELFKELSEIDKRIKLNELSSEQATVIGFSAGPSFSIEGKAKGKVRYLGAPTGGEFAAFLADLADVSKGTTRLSDATRTALGTLTKPVHIRVFVTPT
jgi:hypothetical protein